MGTTTITTEGWCPNRPEKSEFVYELNTEQGELTLLRTSCTEILGAAFGKMCRCWVKHDPATNPEILGWIIEQHREPEMLSVAKKYLTTPGGKWVRARLAALEIFMKARSAGTISDDDEWVELAKMAGVIHSYEQQTELLERSIELGLPMRAVAFVFGDNRVRTIVAEEKKIRTKESLGKFCIGELLNDLHLNLLRYIRRFHKNGDKVVAQHMSRVEQMLTRENYGYLCHRIGWQLPELTEEEKELRENYRLFESVVGVFTNTGTVRATKYWAGDLICAVTYLPNMEKGARFAIRGCGTADRESVKKYLREYSRRVAEAVKSIE